MLNLPVVVSAVEFDGNPSVPN